MGAKSFFFVWVWRQGLVMNKLSIQQVSRDETDTYPLMVLVAFEILQGNSYLYGVVVSLQSWQWLTSHHRWKQGILHTSICNIRDKPQMARGRPDLLLVVVFGLAGPYVLNPWTTHLRLTLVKNWWSETGKGILYFELHNNQQGLTTWVNYDCVIGP